MSCIWELRNGSNLVSNEGRFFYFISKWMKALYSVMWYVDSCDLLTNVICLERYNLYPSILSHMGPSHMIDRTSESSHTSPTFWVPWIDWSLFPCLLYQTCLKEIGHIHKGKTGPRGRFQSSVSTLSTLCRGLSGQWQGIAHLSTMEH